MGALEIFAIISVITAATSTAVQMDAAQKAKRNAERQQHLQELEALRQHRQQQMQLISATRLRAAEAEAAGQGSFGGTGVEGARTGLQTSAINRIDDMSGRLNSVFAGLSLERQAINDAATAKQIGAVSSLVQTGASLGYQASKQPPAGDSTGAFDNEILGAWNLNSEPKQFSMGPT